jgi:transposase
MRATNFIALDVHCAFCEGGYLDQHGQVKRRWRTATSIPPLIEVIEQVPRPRSLVIEEGPLSDWLVRHLAGHVDEMVSCDARRNALIAKDGDKSDAIDWQKLAELYRGGHVRPVHHPDSLSASLLKQHVQLYHDRVAHRVSEAVKIVWRVRRLGVFVKEKDLLDGAPRREMLKQLPQEKIVREDVLLLLRGYDLAAEQVITLRRRLIERSRREPMIKNFCKLPGMGPVRSATFFAILDTPFRFRNRSALWKYMGIGLERRQSGNGPVRLRVPLRCNRILKNVILGAAKSAIASRNNPFADGYQRWLNDGCSPRIARRNVARSLATTMWGMWKSGSVYDERMVCKRTGVLS